MNGLWLRLGLGVAIAFVSSCGEEDSAAAIVGPDLPKGDGRIYPIKAVTFPTVDGVSVGALFGQPAGTVEFSPAVILIHDWSLDNQEWFQKQFFVDLLQQGYLPLAINLRGHGETPLPDDRPAFELADIEDMYHEVDAALTWLHGQAIVDPSRIAVIGSGVGGSVAYVSIGAFPDKIRTAVALSAGMKIPKPDDQGVPVLEPLLVGSSLDLFDPDRVLFVVGGADIQEDLGYLYDFPQWSDELAAASGEASVLSVIDGVVEHGAELLSVEGVSDQIFTWLELHLN